MKIFSIVAGCLLALCVAAALVERDSALPSLDNRSASTALPSTDDTSLRKAIHPMVAEHPGLSGIYPLLDPRDAFAARMLLAQSAERSLDVRYYIWRNDISGTLLFDSLRAAADRGVRVRLLLDDNNTAGLDPLLAALDSHPNIEVRLFNPFVIRAPRWLGYVTDFNRLNRRMHNKSFTADNQATIVGGRNVGDEYFGATDGVVFADLDVLAIGPIVAEVSEDFDRYWGSGSSYPVKGLLPERDRSQIAELATAVSRIEHDPEAVAYVNAVQNSKFVRDWHQATLVPVWAVTRMISDDPAKGLGLAPPEALVFAKLKEIIGESASEVDVVSPYFVPTSTGVHALVALASRGVKVRVLTNALEATDVPAVYAGYAKQRETLLRSGIALYEFRRLSSDNEAKKEIKLAGSSSSSLHAKAFAVDRARVFIGSFNFDPRSASLNTEMGFVIDSPAVAQIFEARLADRIATSTYEVRLADSGKLQWSERSGSGWLRHETEPGTSAWQRARLWFLSLLPVEWLL